MTIPLRLFVAMGILACLGSPVVAQTLDFDVSNGITLEEFAASQAQSVGPPQPVGQDSPQSTSLIAQSGSNNAAAVTIYDSLGAGALAYQSGRDNIASANILNSPGSIIAQIQIGAANISRVGISGGSDNLVAGAQIGNNQDMSIGLLNSRGTKVFYGAVGSDYTGAFIIKDAPPGTVVRVK